MCTFFENDPNAILENEGVHTKLVICPLLHILHILHILHHWTWSHFKAKHSPFILCNANYQNCIFMNFNENIKY